MGGEGGGRLDGGEKEGDMEGRGRGGDISAFRKGWFNLVPHPTKLSDPPRFFTPRECARLQGFPESFRLPGSTKRDNAFAALFGNAVSAPVITAIAGVMMSQERRERQGEEIEKGEERGGEGRGEGEEGDKSVHFPSIVPEVLELLTRAVGPRECLRLQTLFINHGLT